MKPLQIILSLFCAILFLTFNGHSASAASNSYRAVVNGHSYSLQLANNKTSKAFIQRFPMSMKMSELNGNEKYHYLAKRLPSNDQNVHQIHKGDVMLYQSRCIVVFYKNFKTNYEYTRIGHLQGFEHANVGKSAIHVKWERSN